MKEKKKEKERKGKKKREKKREHLKLRLSVYPGLEGRCLERSGTPTLTLD